MSRRNKATPKGGKQNTGVATTDAFSNLLFRLGYGSQSPLEATEYPLTRMTDNYALLNSLYRDNCGSGTRSEAPSPLSILTSWSEWSAPRTSAKCSVWASNGAAYTVVRQASSSSVGRKVCWTSPWTWTPSCRAHLPG